MAGGATYMSLFKFKDAKQNKTCVVSADENSVLQTHDQSAVPEKEATNKQSI